MATIIKANTQRSPAGTTQPPDSAVAEMTNRAGEYLHAVRNEAARILEQARHEADQLRRQARQDASEPKRDAPPQFDSKVGDPPLEDAVAAATEMARQLQHTREQWIREWENNVVRFAAAMASRIVRREIRQDPQITRELIREALELAAGSGETTLQLNPDDYQTLEPHVQQMQNELGTLSPTSIVPDPQVSAGGCRVQTRFGTIDQQVETQLARIEEELTA
jgi:flagellar biosynthesis/type III secretory pathway protein FliH